MEHNVKSKWHSIFGDSKDIFVSWSLKVKFRVYVFWTFRDKVLWKHRTKELVVQKLGIAAWVSIIQGYRLHTFATDRCLNPYFSGWMSSVVLNVQTGRSFSFGSQCLEDRSLYNREQLLFRHLGLCDCVGRTVKQLYIHPLNTSILWLET